MEVKQCSIFSKRLGGTWNDTNEEKALAFSNKKLFTAVGVWKGAADLQFIVYGQHEKLGEYLLERVRAVANTSTRSTQSVEIGKMIKEYGFKVIISPDKDRSLVYKLLINYKKSISSYLSISDLLTINDI
ncbi:hypothetical protein [Bernardetia litoralis]|uniref:hypothetical protein n=1 Tax=Bernardetia litoralis TaxID=999 RepID=UPI000303EEB2|nr:hypothetical protein [Bernardetia litoralis]